MANTVPFILITPTAVAYEGDAELVIAVGTEGEEGILPSHAPFLTALRPGILRANVRDGGDGFIVPARDADAIAEKLELLAAKPGLLAELSENARQYAANFTLEKYGERLIAAFRERQVI